MTALRRAIAGQGDLLEEGLTIDLEPWADQFDGARRIWLVGTGTSQHAAELGARMFEAAGDVRWASAGVFAERAVGLTETDLVVVISHTGETAFARRARQQALDAGARLVSITGRDAGWPEAIETAPRERSETYTASYTATLLALARLAAKTGIAPFTQAEIEAIPDRVRDAVAQEAPALSPGCRLAVLIGAGPAAITAREGALKLREAARLIAEGYEAEYLLHGSAVPLGPDDALLAIQPGDDRFGLTAAVAATAAGEGLDVYDVSEPGGLDPLLAQIPLTARLQAMAARAADQRGVDPDVAIRSGWAADGLWEIGAPP